MDRAPTPPQVLSIQSAVSYGHVGNSAGVFALQRLGAEVWPINTVQFSNHTGYDGWRGTRATAAEVSDLVLGVAERGVLPKLDAVLSGYLGAADIVAVVADAVRRARAANPEVLYCCDPVLGAAGRGFFVTGELPMLIRDHLIPLANVITPNQFELDFLVGGPTPTIEVLLAATDSLRAVGPGVVMVTSVHTEDTPPDCVDVVVSSQDGAWRVRTPVLAVRVGGTGDVIAALFLGRLLRGEEVPDAMARSTASVFALLQQNLASGAGELPLIAGQAALVDPGPGFGLERLR